MSMIYISVRIRLSIHKWLNLIIIYKKYKQILLKLLVLLSYFLQNIILKLSPICIWVSLTQNVTPGFNTHSSYLDKCTFH